MNTAEKLKKYKTLNESEKEAFLKTYKGDERLVEIISLGEVLKERLEDHLYWYGKEW